MSLYVCAGGWSRRRDRERSRSRTGSSLASTRSICAPQRVCGGAAVVEVGPAAETVIDSAKRLEADLIVMATHGRSGLGRWVYGSVADKVLRGADRTIALVRAGRVGGPVQRDRSA
jgi:hypothetical protein